MQHVIRLTVMCMTCNLLFQLHMDSCPQLTNATLHHLACISTTLSRAGLSGTGISQEPDWGSEVKVVLGGCAVDSSGPPGIKTIGPHDNVQSVCWIFLGMNYVSENIHAYFSENCQVINSNNIKNIF